MRTSPKDAHALLQVPGAANKAGTAGKARYNPRKTFNESIGHGSASGGAGQMNGTGGDGDPTIQYKVAPGRPQVLGRTGKFSTKYHTGRMPISYDINLPDFADEY